MRVVIVILALLLSCCMLGAEDAGQKLPRDAQSAMDSYNKAVAKIQEEAAHKVSGEREKLYGALDKSSKEAAKKGDADAIVAIKAEMKKLLADATKDEDTKSPGEKVSASKLIEGKWNLGVTGIVWVFTLDNKCVSQPSGVQGTWTMAKNETDIEVHWSTNEFDVITTGSKTVARTPGGVIPLTPVNEEKK